MRVERPPPLNRHLFRECLVTIYPELSAERRNRLRRSRTRRSATLPMNQMPWLKSGARQFVYAVVFCFDCGEFGCSEIAPRVGDIGDPAVLNRQTSGRDQSGQLGVTKLVQQSPDVSINGLGPDFLPRVEVATHEGGVNAGIRGGSIKCYEASLRIPGDANFAPAAILMLEPVHGSEHLL